MNDAAKPKVVEKITVRKFASEAAKEAGEPYEVSEVTFIDGVKASETKEIDTVRRTDSFSGHKAHDA